MFPGMYVSLIQVIFLFNINIPRYNHSFTPFSRSWPRRDLRAWQLPYNHCIRAWPSFSSCLCTLPNEFEYHRDIFSSFPRTSSFHRKANYKIGWARINNYFQPRQSCHRRPPASQKTEVVGWTVVNRPGPLPTPLGPVCARTTLKKTS